MSLYTALISRFSSLRSAKPTTRKAQPRFEALEDRLALTANGMAVLGIAWGGPTLQGINTAGTVRVNNLANLEATMQGINTAGTVRVNNLANLEAMQQATDVVFGKLAEADGPMPQTREHVLLARQVGLATPGAIHWLVASARDANLLS